MMSSFCEDCVVAAVAMVTLRFTVENVHAMRALGSLWDKLFFFLDKSLTKLGASRPIFVDRWSSAC